LISYYKGRTQIEGSEKKFAEEDIWIHERKTKKKQKRRKLQNEEFYDLHYSPNIVWVIKWVGM
jgi:hypothetical protein